MVLIVFLTLLPALLAELNFSVIVTTKQALSQYCTPFFVGSCSTTHFLPLLSGSKGNSARELIQAYFLLLAVDNIVFLAVLHQLGVEASLPIK
jgi:hypothetical protein